MNGLHIPAPPDGYWATVPWWGYLLFVLILAMIAVVIGPWVIQRSKGALSATASREQVLAGREARLQRLQDEERERLREDRNRGWNLARGWTVLAHGLWHDLKNAVGAANGMLLMLQKVADGRLSADAVRERLTDPDMRPMTAPKKLPDVDGVEPKKPGESKYA